MEKALGELRGLPLELMLPVRVIDSMQDCGEGFVKRILLCMVALVAVSGSLLRAQDAAPPPPKMMAADADPSFEVATIKPTDPDTQGRRINADGRNFVTQNTTLADLIKFAYKVNGKQIVGAPDWWDKREVRHSRGGG